MIKDSFPCGCVVNSSILNYGVILPRAAKAIWSSIQTDYGFSSVKKSFTLLFSLTFFSPPMFYDMGYPWSIHHKITTDFKEKQLEKNLWTAHMLCLSVSTFIYRLLQNTINVIWEYTPYPICQKFAVFLRIWEWIRTISIALTPSFPEQLFC